MAFLTDGTVGADLDAATSAGKFALGDIASGDKGSLWMYVQASTTIGQYDFVGVDEDYKANPLTSTAAAAGHVVGAAQIAVPISEYFWLALQGRGNINGKVASSCAADVALYTTTTAGVLDDSATATQTLVEGVVIVTTQSSTTGLASGTELIATYPRGK
jgi:hypothetical protein